MTSSSESGEVMRTLLPRRKAMAVDRQRRVMNITVGVGRKMLLLVKRLLLLLQYLLLVKVRRFGAERRGNVFDQIGS